jgi:hypothetical protein
MVRRRTWKTGNQTKTAWVADYFDQAAPQPDIRDAPGGRLPVVARHEVAAGIHAPPRRITIAEAADGGWRNAIDKLERATVACYRQHVEHRVVNRPAPAG